MSNATLHGKNRKIVELLVIKALVTLIHVVAVTVPVYGSIVDDTLSWINYNIRY